MSYIKPVKIHLLLLVASLVIQAGCASLHNPVPDLAAALGQHGFVPCYPLCSRIEPGSVYIYGNGLPRSEVDCIQEIPDFVITNLKVSPLKLQFAETTNASTADFRLGLSVGSAASGSNSIVSLNTASVSFTDATAEVVFPAEIRGRFLRTTSFAGKPVNVVADEYQATVRGLLYMNYAFGWYSLLPPFKRTEYERYAVGARVAASVYYAKGISAVVTMARTNGIGAGLKDFTINSTPFSGQLKWLDTKTAKAEISGIFPEPMVIGIKPVNMILWVRTNKTVRQYLKVDLVDRK